MRLRALLTCAFLLSTTAAAQPTPPFHAVRGESSAVIWLGTIENNFPNYPGEREYLRSWHKLNFPWAYAFEDSTPPPENLLLELDVYVTGATGQTARGGIPIPDEKNLEATVAEARVGELVGLARVDAVYPDGTARWVTVALPPATPSGWVRLQLFGGLAPLLNPTRVASTSNGVVTATFTETYPWGSPSTWKSWTNMTPTGTIQGGTQPSCRQFGAPEERVANAAGASIRLRAGEQVAAVADAPRSLWAASSWYRDCQDEAFLGPVAVMGQPGDRGAFVDLCLAELVKRIRTEGNAPGHEPLRDLGEISADHEGPFESTSKTRNNEYGIVDGVLRCFMALVGEPGSTPDPRAQATFEAAILSGRHHANVDTYHCETGPLRWMHGAPFPHTAHGASGTSDPHRGGAANTGHFNIEGVSAVRFLAADPVMDEACDMVQRCARWKAENGPGMPGIPDYTGETRAPANLLRVMLEGRIDQPADSAAYRMAAEIIVQRGALDRAYLNGGTQKEKPFMAVLLIEQLENAERQGIAGAAQAATAMRNRMADYWLLDPDGPNVRLIYQVDPLEPTNPWTGAWGLVAADNLRLSHPALAARLYEVAGKDPWYSGDRVEWCKTLVAQQVITFGHRFAGGQ